MDSSIDPFIPHPGFFIFGLHFADGKAVIQALLQLKMEGAASGRPTGTVSFLFFWPAGL